MKKDTKNTIKQFRVSQDLMDDADKVFKKLNLTTSEAIRLFLTETAKKGKLPFRPAEDNEDQKIATMRKEEAEYVDEVLGIGRNSRIDRFIRGLYGQETSDDLSDGALKEWGLDSGLPRGLSTQTLAELFDSGLFSTNPWSTKNINTDMNYMQNLDEETRERSIMLEQTESIKSNIDETCRKLKDNAISTYLNANVPGFYDDDYMERRFKNDTQR